MKAIFTLLAVAAVALVSCKDDNKGLLDPNAKVYINGATAPASVSEVSKAGQQKLTPLEVVQKANQLRNSITTLGLGDQNRDFAKVRIVGGSIWIINSRGELTRELIESSNNILTIDNKNFNPVDTIAYIPNSTMRTVEAAIKAAHAVQDYATCYRLFEEAYVFLPITGTEYKELQKQGLN